MPLCVIVSIHRNCVEVQVVVELFPKIVLVDDIANFTSKTTKSINLRRQKRGPSAAFPISLAETNQSTETVRDIKEVCGFRVEDLGWWAEDEKFLITQHVLPTSRLLQIALSDTATSAFLHEVHL